MTRPTDEIKQNKSYTVFRKSDGSIEVKPSHFLPGYTVAHKETPQAAILYAIDHAGEQISELEQHKQKLYQALAESYNTPTLY